ncbi:MAG: glycosyltransferase family 39 protein [Acidobacteriales bacterium]|nr:glycosyltransferase family 39 protein [Terriglobales bacterium]
MLRRYPRIFLYGTLAAICLRLAFIVYFSRIIFDSLVYSDIALNWLHHGVFGLTERGVPVPTYIRLPGYPAFLAAVFAIRGPGSFLAVFVIQLIADVGTCFAVAGTAEELAGGARNSKAAPAAFLAAALCPFTANYVALALTETFAIFFAALAMLAAVKAIRTMEAGRVEIRQWSACGAALAAGILLRPDGGILLGALGVYLGYRLVPDRNRKQVIAAGVLTASIALAPLVPWTTRNWRVFHEFQPLAPRYANAPGEFVPRGFNRWMKTWIVDYVSVEEIYWNVPPETPEEWPQVRDLPSRAFDSGAERAEVEKLFAQIDEEGDVSPATDARFAVLAAARIQRHPMRYYVALPVMRILDMWLRPRTEMLPLGQRWWEFEDVRESALSLGFVALNLFLLIAAAYGIWSLRGVPGVGLLLAYVVLRSLFLGTLENPEPRYTLECFPAVLALAGCALRRGKH